MNVQAALLRLIMMDLFAQIDPRDQAYFRASREQRLGKRLEDVTLPEAEGRAAVYASLAPFRATLREQKFLAGETPAYADYILFGALMWAKIVSPKRIVQADDPIELWRQNMLDLFDGLARQAPAIGA
jgi:glutathione S-transferase